MDIIYWDFDFSEPQTPKCKHGEHVCRKCGVYRTQVTHATVGGKGAVGQAVAKSKQK